MPPRQSHLCHKNLELRSQVCSINGPH
jgi:hypothetical protein